MRALIALRGGENRKSPLAHCENMARARKEGARTIIRAPVIPLPHRNTTDKACAEVWMLSKVTVPKPSIIIWNLKC